MAVMVPLCSSTLACVSGALKVKMLTPKGFYMTLCKICSCRVHRDAVLLGCSP